MRAGFRQITMIDKGPFQAIFIHLSVFTSETIHHPQDSLSMAKDLMNDRNELT